MSENIYSPQERWNKIPLDAGFISNMDMIRNFEISRRFCGHGFAHVIGVARIMYIISLEENLPVSKDLIYGAGILHDIGRAAQYSDGTPHDEAGAAAAAEILKNCGYDEDEIREITAAIAGHRGSSAAGMLAELLRTADRLSRPCYCCEASDECNWTEEKKNRKSVY